MRQLPTINELLRMSRSAIKRLSLTSEELQTLGPNARIVIASKTRPEARQLIIRRNRSGISVRVRGNRSHHRWEIAKRDYRLLLPEEKKRIEHKGVPVVDEYHEGSAIDDLREWEDGPQK
jgi:hypothetical protein